MNVNAYRINFPENYLERIVKVNIPTKKVNFYTLSLEDLVVSKLCAMRGKDIEDIENELVYNSLDWDLLDRLVDDVCYGMLTDFDKNILLEHYKDYKERFK
jgi:predicted nucleotidyltransferase